MCDLVVFVWSRYNHMIRVVCVRSVHNMFNVQVASGARWLRYYTFANRIAMSEGMCSCWKDRAGAPVYISPYTLTAQPMTHRYTTRPEDARTESLDCARLQYTVCVNPHATLGSCHHFQDAPTGVRVFSSVRTRPPLATTPPCCRRNHLCRLHPRRPRFHRSRLRLRHLRRRHHSLRHSATRHSR